MTTQRTIITQEAVLEFMRGFAEGADVEIECAAQHWCAYVREYLDCNRCTEELRKGFEAGLRFGRKCVISQ